MMSIKDIYKVKKDREKEREGEREGVKEGEGKRVREERPLYQTKVPKPKPVWKMEGFLIHKI